MFPTASLKAAILFVMLNAVINIPNKLNKIQATINKFIWNRTTSRLKLAITEQTLLSGGVTIPNVRKYFNAEYLSVCTGWWKMSPDVIN